ncbi:Protein ViaA [Dirofilaria immitis]
MDAITSNFEVTLFERWNDLTSTFVSEFKEKWWKRLTIIYSKRSFHNLKHLNDMFQLFDKYKDKLQEQTATAFAIFFLHAVHDLKKNNNAERSAELLQQFLSETTFDLENYSRKLILGSGKHCTDAHLTPDTYGEGDIHFLLDFDIAFLGVDEIEYDMHSKNIRNEYDHLNDDQYRQQRF